MNRKKFKYFCDSSQNQTLEERVLYIVKINT